MCISFVHVESKETELKKLQKEQRNIEKAIETNLSLSLPTEHLQEALNGIKSAINAVIEVSRMFKSKGGK